MENQVKSKNQLIHFKGMALTIKREDLLHPEISGNKYRKLKYNLLEAKNQQKQTILTFGGAFSNHIAATAAAGAAYGFKTIGIIRGEELKDKIYENPTLSYARSQGMQLIYISRSEYRQKNDAAFKVGLKNKYGDCYIVPEGGTNQFAIKGCEEILQEDDHQFEYICTSVGTGGTMIGLINSARGHQQVLGFSALKGDFLKEEIRKHTSKKQWELITDYHFGGYGKIKPELITFINEFKELTKIPLDPIYTGKMMYGIFDLFSTGYFRKEAKILVVHTGGLQGIEGMNIQLKQKGVPIIK